MRLDTRISLFFLVAIGCGPKVLELRPAAEDSTKMKEKLNITFKFDSVESKKAFGNLNFGLTQKQFDRLSKKERDLDFRIGANTYWVRPQFDNSDSLYMIEITGVSQTANYIDTDVHEKYDLLVEMIKKKYGKPSRTKLYPTIYDHESGYIQFATYWEGEEKMISVGVGETDARYYPVIWIYNKRMRQKSKEDVDKKLDTAVSTNSSKF